MNLSIDQKLLLGKIFKLGHFQDWRIHREDPTFPPAPFKIQVRHLVRDDPTLCRLMCDLFWEKVCDEDLNIWFHAFADLPIAISPVVTMIAQMKDMSMVTLDYKDNRVLGRTYPNIRLLVFDDVLTFGHSKKDALELVKRQMLKIVGLVVFVDYELGAKQRFKAKYGIDVYSVFTISNLLKQLEGIISSSDTEKINNWLNIAREHKHLIV